MDTAKKIEKIVLLIEDNDLLLKLYSTKLRRDGLEIVAVHNAEDALKAISLHQPGLVILDLGMPGMGGLEFLNVIRNDPKTRELRVIVITASDNKEDEEKARQLGVSDYLGKSEMSLDNLALKVESYFN